MQEQKLAQQETTFSKVSTITKYQNAKTFAKTQSNQIVFSPDIHHVLYHISVKQVGTDVKYTSWTVAVIKSHYTATLGQTFRLNFTFDFALNSNCREHQPFPDILSHSKFDCYFSYDYRTMNASRVAVCTYT
jgi:hypothetical protein